MMDGVIFGSFGASFLLHCIGVSKGQIFTWDQSRLRVDHIMQGYYVRRQQNVDLFMDKRGKKGMQKLPMPTSLTSLLL